MKKIISIVMILVLTLTISVVPTFAAETNMSSVVKYYVQEEFMVSIPLEINVGDKSEIFIIQNNFPHPKQIDVTMDGAQEMGEVLLYNVEHPQQTITVYLYGNDGNVLTTTNNLVGSLDSETLQSIYIDSGVFGYDPYNTVAGTYTGSVYFSLDCHDRQ